MPRVPSLPEGKQDPHSRRFEGIYRFKDMELTDEQLINVRRAYYANVSYVDDKIGRLLAVLKRTGLDENTWIIFTADHGDMLGERGLWWKKHLYEDSSRVPLVVHAPGRFEPGRVVPNVSLVDLFPTLVEAAGIDPVSDLASPIDGNSLMGLLAGRSGEWPDTVYCENFEGGTPAPMFMVRKGQYKYVSCPIDPAQLYDLEADPLELKNLAGHPDFESIEAEFKALVHARWDAAELQRRIAESHRARDFLHAVLSSGKRTSWDFEPEPGHFTLYKGELDSYYDWFGRTV
jgi:choline-sulfatase